MDQIGMLVAKIDGLLKSAQNSERSAKKAVTWLVAAKKAAERGDWVQMAALLKNKDREFLRASGAVPPTDIDAIEAETSKYSLDAQLQFAEQVKARCQAFDLKAVDSGQRHELRVQGIIEVVPDFTAGKVTVRTISSKETVSECTPEAVVRKIKEIAKRLFGRPFSPQEFLNELHRAYRVSHADGQSALLSDVQGDLWHLKQPSGFWQSYDLSKAHSYTTDEFSVDLGKLLSSGLTATSEGKKLNLSTHGGGIPVYGVSGTYDLYKFISFT